MTKISGVHPYADEFPMASEEELDELVGSIAAVGLIQPLVVIGTVAGVEDGRLADGRNRRVACERAGVEPKVEVRDFASDDELKEFVIGVNTTGRRESMSVQIAAASSALILGEGLRNNGRWTRNTHTHDSVSMDRTMANVLAQCGLILDILGRDALREVRDGKAALNAVYERALAAREEERQSLEDEERAEAEEAEAKSYLEEHEATDILAEVGTKYDNHRQARAVWLERNRKEKARLERERREHQDAIQRDANRVKAFLSGFDGAYSMRAHPHRDEVLKALGANDRKRFLKIESEMTWPTNRV